MGNGLNELNDVAVLMHSLCQHSTLEQTKSFTWLPNAAMCYAFSSAQVGDAKCAMFHLGASEGERKQGDS